MALRDPLSPFMEPPSVKGSSYANIYDPFYMAQFQKPPVDEYQNTINNQTARIGAAGASVPVDGPGMSLLQGLGYVLDLPGRGVRSLVEKVAPDAMKGFSEGGSHWLTQTKGMQEGLGTSALGFLLDMVTDPTMYVGVGLAKGGASLTARAAREAAIHAGELGLAKELAPKLAVKASIPFTKIAGEMALPGTEFLAEKALAVGDKTRKLMAPVTKMFNNAGITEAKTASQALNTTAGQEITQGARRSIPGMFESTMAGPNGFSSRLAPLTAGLTQEERNLATKFTDALNYRTIDPAKGADYLAGIKQEIQALSPEKQVLFGQLAKETRSIYSDIERMAKNAGNDFESIKHYVYHMYEQSPEQVERAYTSWFAEQEGKRAATPKLRGDGTYLQHRTIMSPLDAEKYGLTQIMDPEQLVAARTLMQIKDNVFKDMRNQLKDISVPHAMGGFDNAGIVKIGQSTEERLAAARARSATRNAAKPAAQVLADEQAKFMDNAFQGMFSGGGSAIPSVSPRVEAAIKGMDAIAEMAGANGSDLKNLLATRKGSISLDQIPDYLASELRRHVGQSGGEFAIHGKTLVAVGQPAIAQTTQQVVDEALKAPKIANAFEAKTKSFKGLLPDGWVRGDKLIPGMEGYAFHPDLARTIMNMTNAISDRGVVKGLLESTAKVTSVWKSLVTSTPGQIIRNTMGNNLNMYLGDVALQDLPNLYAKAIQVIHPRMNPDAIVQVGKFTGTAGQVMDMFMKEHLNGFGQAWDVLHSGSSMRKAATTSVLDKAQNLATKITAPMRKANEMVESSSKMAMFLDRLGKGNDFQTAARDVRKFLFDYSDLTPFERKLRGFMPFYTWTRKQMPLLMEATYTKPQVYTALQHARSNALEGQGITPDMMPDWMNKNLSIPIKQEDGSLRMVDLGLPTNLLGQITLPGGSTSVTDAAAQTIASLPGGLLHPALKTPIELATNTNMFSGKPIESRQYETKPFMGQQIDAKTAYLLQQIPMPFFNLFNPNNFGAIQSGIGQENTPTEGGKIPDKPQSDLGVLLARMMGMSTVNTPVNPAREQTVNKMLRAKELTDFVTHLRRDQGINVPSTAELKKDAKSKEQQMRSFIQGKVGTAPPSPFSR